MRVTDRKVEAWLREDVGHHDVTNHVPGETTGRLVAKEAVFVATPRAWRRRPAGPWTPPARSATT